MRKFALRLGKVTKEEDWHLKDTKKIKRLLQTRSFLQILDAAAAGQPLPTLSEPERQQLANIANVWRALNPSDLKLGLKQKGVDMRIGIDIATLTLKKQVDTIILVTGDSDFVPAAKLARREGVEFLLDPLWQQVNDDLNEHVDGIISIFPRPGTSAPEDIPPESVVQKPTSAALTFALAAQAQVSTTTSSTLLVTGIAQALTEARAESAPCPAKEPPARQE